MNPRSGAVSGVLSVLAFTWVHDLLISDIWAMLPIMGLAGAACGLCLAWSYGVLASRPSLAGWLAHNLAFVVMFGLLGAVSVAMFEPVTTLAAITETGGPVDDLVVMALPMTVAFTAVSAGLLTLVYRAGRAGFLPALATCAVMMLFLGLNISAIGLVDIPTGSLYLVGELFALTIGLGTVHAVVYAILERRALQAHDGPARTAAAAGLLRRPASPP